MLIMQSKFCAASYWLLQLLQFFEAVEFKADKKRQSRSFVTFQVHASPTTVVRCTSALPNNAKLRLERNVLLASLCVLRTLSFCLTYAF